MGVRTSESSIRCVPIYRKRRLAMQTPSLKAELSDAVARASSWSPFLRLLLDREPAIAAGLAAGRLDLTASSSTHDMPVARRLRLDRRALALSVAIGDLAGVLDLTAVTHALSDFADRALDVAIRSAILERTPDAPVRGFAGIALGKQGSRELNYSSDIDPILIFDPADAALPPARGPRGRRGPDRSARGRTAAGARRRRLCPARRSSPAAVARGHADRAAGRCRDRLLRIAGAALGARGVHPRAGGGGGYRARHPVPGGDPPVRVAARARFRRGARIARDVAADPRSSRAGADCWARATT